MSSEKLTKLSDYLEKRKKLSLMGRWKKLWCVLEGQLLLYYKSRIDYTKLSPCCGSINMTLVRNVQPHNGCQIYIMTHTQLIVLRAKNKVKQQQWFHALVGVLPQNSYLSPLLYFSTSPIRPKRKYDYKKRSKILSTTETRSSTPTLFEETETCDSTTNAQENIYIENHENQTTSSEIPNFSKTNESEQPLKIKEIDTLKLMEHNTKQNSVRQYNQVMRKYSSYPNINNVSPYCEELLIRRSISYEYVRTNQTFIEEIKSKIHEQKDFVFKRQNSKQPIKRNRRCTRSTSEVKKNESLGRKSLSFLKKMFTRKTQSLSDEDFLEFNEKNKKISQDIDELAHTRFSTNSLSKKRSADEIRISCNENCDSNAENIENGIIFHGHEELTVNKSIVNENDIINFTLSEIRAESSTDEEIDNNNTSKSAETKQPFIGNETSTNFSNNFNNSTSKNVTQIISENQFLKNKTINMSPNLDLDSLLLQLTTLNNNEQEKSMASLEFANNTIEDFDYDIPIPHHSVVKNNLKDDNCPHHSSTESISNNYIDSLSLDMAPDSLEIPWMETDSTIKMNYWNTTELNLGLDNDSDTDYGYQDSLNSNKYYR